jgi:hypothetical protein
VLWLDDILLHHEAECLGRFLSHIDAPVALTGGVAIQLHAERYGLQARKSATNRDVDFVARDLPAIGPTATADFLVSHYHLPQPKFLVQLVDPISRVRDMFPHLVDFIAHAEETGFRDYRVKVLTREAILAHKMQILNGALAKDHVVDPKHYCDAIVLSELLGETAPTFPMHLLAPDVYSTDVTMRCVKCEASRTTLFTLAPKPAIYAILGHV